MEGQTKASNGQQPPQPAVGQGDETVLELNSHSIHDLVGPMNQMRSMADLILKKHRDAVDDETEVLFGYLQAASDKVENLMNGIRKYMRIVGQGMPHRDFDANAALSGALTTIQESIDSSHARVITERLPKIYGDPNQIGYTFASLIENAIRFRGESPPEIRVAAHPEPDGWVFSVSDNGIGIEPKHRERIFGAFQRIDKETYPGSGMGLTIAKCIVEQHGGRIWVESEPGRGSTFLFTLRAAPVDSREGPGRLENAAD